MKSLPVLAALFFTWLPMNAQVADTGASRVRVSIQRFTSEGTPPQLDGLRSVLPNLVQASLFQFDWLTSEVSQDRAAPANSGGAAGRYQFEVRGQYTQIGQRIRVDMRVVDPSDGHDVTGDSATFALADMTAEMQKLAIRCALIMQSRVPSRPSGPGVLVSAAFADTRNDKRLSYLSGTIPAAVFRSLGGADLGNVTQTSLPGERGSARFAVSGSFQLVGDRVRVGIKVADNAGSDLSFEIESTDRFGFKLPQTVAARVLEVLRGLVEQSASTDVALRPSPTDSGANLIAADLASGQGRQNLAILLYRRAQHGKSAVPALRLIGIYREQRGGVEAALSEAQMLASSRISSVTAARSAFSEGLIHLLRSENTEAIQMFNKAMASGIESEMKPYVYLAIGDAQLALASDATDDKAALEMASDAVASYQRALDAGIADASAYRSFARACARAQQPEKAIAALEKAHGRESANLQVIEDLASLYRDQGVRLFEQDKFEEARAWLDKSLRLNPATASVIADAASYQASILAFQVNPPKTAEAVSLLQRAIAANPQDEWALRQLAYQNRLTHKYDDAVRIYKTAIDAGGYYGYSELADTYLEINQFDLAIGTLQKAIGVGKGVVETYLKLAQTYSDHGDTALALDNVESAKKTDPSDDWPWRVQAETLREAARYQESIQAWQQALKLHDGCAAWIGLGDTYRSQKLYEEALDKYRHALTLSGTNCSSANRGIALALANEGKEAEAIKALNDLVGADPAADGPYGAVADVYGLLGKPEIARAQLDAQLRKFPDSSDLLGAMSDLLHDYIFDFEGAYQMRKKDLAIEPLDLLTRGNMAETAVTAGHYSEALKLTAEVQNERAASMDLRFDMRIVTSMALLATHDHARAQLEVGRFISDYRATTADWDRTWIFTGSRRFVSQSQDFEAIDRELLGLMFTALEQHRPKSDEVVKQIEALVTSDRFRVER